MSHELRTPMNGVMGMVALALLRAADPQQIQWLNMAHGSAKHLLSIINDILDLSGMESHQLRLEHAELTLRDQIERLAGTLAPEAARRGLAFQVDVPPALAERPLLGDAQRLAKILLNLAGNAVKFTPKGWVKVSACVEAERTSGPVLRFDVRDSGIGIAARDQERLFNAFVQVEDTMSRSHGGSGLGLAICKQLVQLMGGQIGLDSVLGEGSTFWFTVPLGAPAAQSPVDPGGEETHGAMAALAAEFPGARVLLAEDNAVNQEIVRGLVEAAGLRLVIASNGLAAVDLALAGEHALILMDLQMPGLSGVDATRAIRHAAPPHPRVPVIGFTASVFDPERARYREAGMDEVITKPLRPAVFYSTLLRWLRRRAG